MYDITLNITKHKKKTKKEQTDGPLP